MSEVLGKVASPPGKEATSDTFWFWVKPGVSVEKGQIVRADSTVGGRLVRFYGLTLEVYRQSRLASLAEEFDRHDGDPTSEPPFCLEGFTFAEVAVLRSEPALYAPPREGSNVVLGESADAQIAYGMDEMERPLSIGVIRNGGEAFAGPGRIDTDYLLGANGGHLNVNGTAGRASKSAFLLHVIDLLVREARRQEKERPSDPERLRVVPVILNVKNFDLFHIDRWGKKFDPDRHLGDWQQVGVDDPRPFRDARFLTPQLKGSANAADPARPQNDVKPYSWCLADVIGSGLLPFLFAEADTRDANFSALVNDLEAILTDEVNGARKLNPNVLPSPTFQGLRDYLRGGPSIGSHHAATIKKLDRRLSNVLDDAVLRLGHDSNPLDVMSKNTVGPTVIDLSTLSASPEVQRFVAATVFRQLVEDRTGSAAQRGLVYVVMLDELNRFAPRGATDPITRLIERVAAEMRSQGVILLGGQQQASLVSERVIENCGIRALGHTGSMELSHNLWKFLGESAKRKAGGLRPEEKLVMQSGFREPLLLKIPMPPWALRGAEATDRSPFPDADPAPPRRKKSAVTDL